MDIDISQLKKETADAVEEAKRDERNKVAKVMEKNARRLKRIESRATDIIESIPDKCHEAAKAGMNKAMIMKVKDRMITRNNWSNKLEYTQLKDEAALVWNACMEAKLNPIIRFCHDGVGITSWFEIWANWGE